MANDTTTSLSKILKTDIFKKLEEMLASLRVDEEYEEQSVTGKNKGFIGKMFHEKRKQQKFMSMVVMAISANIINSSFALQQQFKANGVDPSSKEAQDAIKNQTAQTLQAEFSKHGIDIKDAQVQKAMQAKLAEMSQKLQR